MLYLKVKNFIRLVIASIDLLIKGRVKEKKKLYCNLIGGNSTGGPDRFLYNLSNSKTSKLQITNWFLSECRSALVFSASWGDSFTYLCKKFKIKSVLRVDGFYVPDDIIDDEFQLPPNYRSWVNKRLKRDLEKFDHIIYQSDFSKSICDQYLYKRNANYSIIHNGINIEHFKPTKRKSVPNSLRLLMLGKHYPKHIRLAINILQYLKDIQNIELVIVGPMRNGLDIVKEFIEQENIEDSIKSKVTSLGIVTFSELPSVLNSADILLHVKVGDWCPNAVIEAMGCSLPIVCPSWGGTRELVGDAGICIDGAPWSIDSKLAEGMAKAIMDVYSELPTYQFKARERVVNNFNINDVSQRYLNVLEY